MDLGRTHGRCAVPNTQYIKRDAYIPGAMSHQAYAVTAEKALHQRVPWSPPLLARGTLLREERHAVEPIYCGIAMGVRATRPQKPIPVSAPCCVSPLHPPGSSRHVHNAR